MLRVIAALLAGLLLCAQTPMLPGFPPGTFQNRAALDAGSAPGCSQATNFLARTSGMSAGDTTAVAAFICGLVTDGVITGTMSGSGVGASACGTKLDTLYILATNVKANAQLNLCSTSFALTEIGTMSFTADLGYIGSGSPATALDTNYVPSVAVGAYALNSAGYGFYNLTNRTTTSPVVPIGSQGAAGVPFSGVTPYDGSSNFQYDVNGSSYPSASNTFGTAQGSWFINRTASNLITVYRNGASFTTSAGAPSSLQNVSFYVCGLNGNGSVGQIDDLDRIAAAWAGGNFSATDVTNFQTRLNTYMTALGINVY